MKRFIVLLVILIIGTTSYSQVVYSYHSPENKGNFVWQKYTIRFSEDTQSHLRWGSMLYQLNSVRGIFGDDYYSIPYSDIVGIKDFLTYLSNNLMEDTDPNGSYLTFRGISIWMSFKAKGRNWECRLATYDKYDNSSNYLLNFYIQKNQVSEFLKMTDDILTKIKEFVGDKETTEIISQGMADKCCSCNK